MIACEKERVLIVCRKRKRQCERFIKRGLVRAFILSVLGISTIFISQLKFSDFLHGPEACG